ncbi:MAG: enoyl-CoA hydratase-related protein [Polaromonas sp.]|nr:enoyl-CoA hydratase-related protein [Polaromonas sp.]
MSDYQTLQVRSGDGAWHITLNRPEVRNAMSLLMVQELRAVLAQAEQSGAARVLVLRGAGDHFCAGADLKDMAAARMKQAQAPAGADLIAQVNAAFGELCVAYAQTGLVVVAVLQGSVMGGGLGLACVADIALADETASLRLPEVTLGVLPAQIAPFLVQRLGYSEARRLAVCAVRIDAQQALALRLVHGVYAPALLDDAVNQLLQDILQCAPGAVAATKALMALALTHAPADLVEHAAQVFSAAAQGPEGIEGARWPLFRNASLTGLWHELQKNPRRQPR